MLKDHNAVTPVSKSVLLPDGVCEIVWWSGMINSVLLLKEQSDLGLHLLLGTI